MHFYSCPHCDPCEESHLLEEATTIEKCEHKKGFFRSDKKCKEEEYKCRTMKILKCNKCKSSFNPSKKFLQEQKRKIKDG